MNELMQIGRGLETIRKEGDLCRVPLTRGYAETRAVDHGPGLWVIAMAPVYENDDLGRDRNGQHNSDVALLLPALKADDTSCLVSMAVAFWIDLGYILHRLQVIE